MAFSLEWVNKVYNLTAWYISFTFKFEQKTERGVILMRHPFDWEAAVFFLVFSNDLSGSGFYRDSKIFRALLVVIPISNGCDFIQFLKYHWILSRSKGRSLSFVLTFVCNYKGVSLVGILGAKYWPPIPCSKHIAISLSSVICPGPTLNTPPP